MTDQEMTIVLREQAVKMTGAYALVQGYAVTGFARVEQGELRFPPDLWTAEKELPLSLLFDIRIFQKDGEWHAWRDSDGEWGHRELGTNPPEDCQALHPRTHVLWGTKVLPDKSDADWVCCTEDRGIRLFVPRAAVNNDPHTVPFALRIIDYAKVDRDDFTVTIEDSRIDGFALNNEIDRWKGEQNG